MDRVRRESAQKKVQKRIAKEEAIATRRCNFSHILSEIQAKLEESFAGNGMKVYVNQSQLNVDFNDKNKAYTTCSRTHESVRVQIRLKSIEHEHGEELCEMLRKVCFGRYRFKVEEIKTDALQIGVMVPQEDLEWFFKKVGWLLMPLTLRRMVALPSGSGRATVIQVWRSVLSLNMVSHPGNVVSGKSFERYFNGRIARRIG
jgi:hypothetical protein